MFIKPAPGLKVRDPISKFHVPETGREVSDTDSFWVRRLADGDVVLCDAASDSPTIPAVVIQSPTMVQIVPIPDSQPQGEEK